MKAKELIEVTLSGIEIDVKDLQPDKAKSQIEVTLLGLLMDIKYVK